MLPVGLGVALSLFGDLTLFAVLVTQLDRLGITLAQAGILLSIHRLVRIPFNPLAGWIQDRIGRRAPFLTGLLLAVASTAAYGLVQGFWPFLLARVAWGAAWSLINVGGIAMALDLSDGSNRGRLTGIYSTWVWLGYGIGPVIGSLLTDSLGFSRAMLICAGFSALGLAAVLWMLPETRLANPAPAAPDAKTIPMHSGGLWKSMFIFGANNFAMDGIILSTITLLISIRLGTQVGLAGLTLGAASFGGLVMSARAALAALSSPLIGRLSDRGASRMPVILAGLGLGLLAFILLAAGHTLAWILLGVLCGALSASILMVCLPAQVGDETPVQQRALAAGKLAAAGDVGSMLGPFLALSLAPITGLEPIYLLCAALFATGFIISGGPAQLFGRRTRPAAPDEPVRETMTALPALELIPMHENDLDALVALYRRCEDFLALGPQPLASPEMVLADLAHSRADGGTFYGIYTGAGLRGVLDLTESGWKGRADTAYLSLLMLAREVRGQGLGSQVLAYVEQGLRRKGVSRLCAGVQANNPLAIRFWQAHGFRITSEPILQADGTTTYDIEKQTGL